MWCNIFCYNNNVIPLSRRLIAVMNRASITDEISPREFVTFLYLLEQIQISVVKTVGSHLCVNTVVDVFHFITDSKYRRVMDYFIHLVKKQLWYFDTLCKYIDYRIYEHDESVLLSVIPTYMPIWIAHSSNMDSIIYCETMNILNVSTTSSITFFIACIRKLSLMLSMHPLCVLTDVVQPYTIPNPVIHEKFLRIIYSKNVYYNVCDYLEWFESKNFTMRNLS